MFYVVTGGSGSGKSEYAEQLICERENAVRYYIATMQADDAESRQRIRRHQNMRAGKRFVTVECFRDLQDLHLLNRGDALLECMSNLVANELFTEDAEDTKSDVRTEETQESAWYFENRAAQTEEKILRGIEHINEQADRLVVVTNEIFSDGVHYDPWTCAYQKCLAAVNRKMAEQADHVIEVVYGQACMVK